MLFKKILIAVMLFSIFAISSNVYSQRGDKPKKSPEEMATKMADKMKTNLSLTDAQYRSVHDIIMNHMNDMQINKGSWKDLTREERKTMMTQRREELRKQFSTVLTSEQMTKLDQMKKDHSKKRGDRKSGKMNKDKRNL
jgi:hypothetical protein